MIVQPVVKPMEHYTALITSLLTWGHILHWYFLMLAWGWPGCPAPPPGPGGRAWPSPWLTADWLNTLAPLMGCGTRTEAAPEAGGELEAADSGLAEGE